MKNAIIALLFLGLVVAVVAWVVAARRTDAPWARSFRSYLVLGACIVALRVGFYVIVGHRFGAHPIVTLPEIDLPDWAAGIRLGGTVTLEGVLGAAYEGLRLATLVVCLGEFGRTPRINAIGSRDHWHQCYFSVWAGGGVQPGRAIGESDARGEFPVTAPITPEMVATTIVDLAGVDQQQRAEFRVLEGGRVIDELF